MSQMTRNGTDHSILPRLIILKRLCDPDSHFSEKGCLASTHMQGPWEVCSSLLINELAGWCTDGPPGTWPSTRRAWGPPDRANLFIQADSDGGVPQGPASGNFTYGLCKPGQDLPGQGPLCKGLSSHPSSSSNTIPTVLNATCLEGQHEAS